jgi:prepilin-type N-terminal cleavage/methylation domain-containing protein
MRFLSKCVNKKSLGFTLLEMILVIGLIALLAGLTAGSFDSLSSAFSNDSWEKKFKTMLARARNEARSKQLPIQIRFDEEKALWCLRTKGTEEDLEMDSGLKAQDRSQIEIFALLASNEPRALKDLETSEMPIPYIWIQPCGAMTYCQLVMKSKGQQQIIRPDPFSSAFEERTLL